MSGVSGFSAVPALSNSVAFDALKQCASFDMHGLIDAGLARVKTGSAPVVLSSADGFIEAVKSFGVPINDKRSVSISDWKPSNAEMFKAAERKITDDLGIAASVKPVGPKLS